MQKSIYATVCTTADLIGNIADPVGTAADIVGNITDLVRNTSDSVGNIADSIFVLQLVWLVILPSCLIIYWGWRCIRRRSRKLVHNDILNALQEQKHCQSV